MSAHDFCRVLLKITMEGTREEHPRRVVRATVDACSVIGRCRHYSVTVDDSLDPGTGTHLPGSSQAGHFRSLSYEVEACCAWSARVEAINAHERKFDAEVV